MPDIKKITLPSGSTYDIVDAGARSLIAALSGSVSWLGITTTALTDGATTNPITVSGESVTASPGGIAAYGEREFVWNGSKWQEFGSTGSLKALAFKDSASGPFTPAGTVSKPGVTVTPTTDNVYSITDVGTLPALTMTVSNENLTISFSQGSLPTKGVAQAVMTGATAELAAAPAFTGTAGTVTVS